MPGCTFASPTDSKTQLHSWRLHGELGHHAPVEIEDAYYVDLERLRPAGLGVLPTVVVDAIDG